MQHPLLKHARNVIHSRLKGLNWRDLWQGAMTRPSKGCFVSLKVGPRLRGCIGTLEPVRPSLEEEIAHQHAGGVAPNLSRGLFGPAGIGFVHHIVVEQGGGV